METLLLDKFLRNENLQQRLVQTEGKMLEENFTINSQSNSFWGTVNGKGSNNLGRLLMKVRTSLLDGSAFQKWFVLSFKLQMEQFLRARFQVKLYFEETQIANQILEGKSHFSLGGKDSDFDLIQLSGERDLLLFFLDCKLGLVLLLKEEEEVYYDGIKLEIMVPFVVRKEKFVLRIPSKELKVNIRVVNLDQLIETVEEKLSNLSSLARKNNRMKFISQKEEFKRNFNSFVANDRFSLLIHNEDLVDFVFKAQTHFPIQYCVVTKQYQKTESFVVQFFN